jgi:GNAT superfamily N-acetyltransferase
MPHEIQHAGYLVSDDSSRLDVDAIHAFLTRCRWAVGIPRDVVARSVANSLCLGIHTSGGDQVGLVRVITDYATFAYVCDVYVLEEHRGRGLAKAAMQAYATHPKLQDLRREHLVTPDMQALYQQFGFSPVAHPGRHMEKTNTTTFQRAERKS